MNSGGFWCVLVGAGGFWWVLVCSGEFWWLLVGSGEFRGRLQGVGTQPEFRVPNKLIVVFRIPRSCFELHEKYIEFPSCE